MKDLESLGCSAASAIVAPAPTVDLFAWAKEKARQVAQDERDADNLRARLDEAEKNTAETVEWKEHEEAKEDLSETKKAVLDANPDVTEKRETKRVRAKALRQVAAYKVARELKKQLRALEERRAIENRGIVKALSDGVVPKPTLHVGGAEVVVDRVGKDAAAGRD